MTTIALIGAPHDTNSSFMRGCASAPDAIRRAMFNGASNLTSESGLDLSLPDVLVDRGDVVLDDTPAGVMGLTAPVLSLISEGLAPLTLGGDHSVTHALVAAMHAAYGPVDILHFDAHSDIYEDFQGNPYSHASPFARIVEQGFAGRLVQIGVRTLTEGQRQMIDRYGVECHTWRGFNPADVDFSFKRPVYISIDIDALDPAFAPGISHHEPGGMSCNDILDILARVEGRVVGADIVEYNPARDWQDMTAMVCVKFVKELAALLARPGEPLSN